MSRLTSSRLWPLLAACIVTVFASHSAAADDLASLPEYQPQQQISGVLRSWGTPQMGAVLKNWQAGFRQYHPSVAFEDNLKGSASGMIGLEEVVADLVLMGRRIVPYDTYGIWRRSHLLPMEIEVATGSFAVPRKSTALTVFVHKDNPLTKLTLQQLDGIFGAQRTGGWQNMEWVPEAGRSAKDNIRRWGQLGLTGAWANKRIHPLGPPGIYPGGMTYFQTRVLQGGDTWNEELMEYADRKAMLEALAKDRYGIAYAAMSYADDHVKPIALAEKPGATYVEPTKANVANRSYPLARPVYVYFAPDYGNGDPRKEIEPKLREFLRYILSRQGQQDVMSAGDYLPLTADIAQVQLRRLEQGPVVLKRISP
jgi:phosphate transport system substrate-binding protein